MSKALQKDISFSLKVQMVQAKMNLYLNLPVYSLTVYLHCLCFYPSVTTYVNHNNVIINE